MSTGRRYGPKRTAGSAADLRSKFRAREEFKW